MIIDESSRELFQTYWDTPKESQGRYVDTFFITDANWLQDAVVIDHIHYGEGLWHINLIFVRAADTRTFISRRIRSCPTQARATFDARFFKRTAGKDPNGTLAITLAQFDCPLN